MKWHDFVLVALVAISASLNPAVGIVTALMLIFYELREWRETTRDKIADDILNVMRQHIDTGELKVEVNLDKEMKGWRS